MQQTSFQAYYTARMLDNLSEEDLLSSAFASSDIKIYPFQVAASAFALRSSYRKGAVLCDEAGMGKSHEAMLVITQKWLEGCNRILLLTPNADLLRQWTELIDLHYTIPYVVLADREDWKANTSEDSPNAFFQNGIIISTYDFVANNEQAASEVNWELTVFEEANALSSVYRPENKQARTLKRIAGNSFKILLSGTPIEKNIMDLYGLIWFIDESVLPDEREFLSRYLRKPENYPELAERVSGYCFRTLRSQAKGYAKVTERVLLTNEYEPSPSESKLYDLLYKYINKPNKAAFPEMDKYDLALRLLSLQSSSTAAILQTVNGVIKRLEALPNVDDELAEFREILQAAEDIKQDTKAKLLLSALKSGFSLMKKSGARKKAVIFTESVETQKMLADLLSEKYRTYVYNGSADYSVIREFKLNGEVLISTDNGAKGFNLENASFVIHYDLPYNTLKMEQRIDRCHRLGQENDVLSLAFINKNNFADVRKLELVNKRMSVASGVFGITDDVIGGFTGDLVSAFESISENIRSREQIETDHSQRLTQNKDENKRLVSAAEDILFTTFSKEIADKVNLSPKYIGERSEEINASLWEVVKWFFERYNDTYKDCRFEIDEVNKTVTATNYDDLPMLFYYWTGSRNKPYYSQKSYGMAKDFKPRHGRITSASVIGRGILHELECADSGSITVDADIEPCEIALYTVTVSTNDGFEKESPVLCGQTASGDVLSNEQCQSILNLPVKSCEESEHKCAHWLKSGGHHKLDKLVPRERIAAECSEKLSSALADEIDKIKLGVRSRKNAIAREIDELEKQVKTAECERDNITDDRFARLALEKKVNLLRRELMKKQEGQFLEEMKLDLEMEQQIKEITDRKKPTTSVTQEFVVKVRSVLWN